MSLRIERARPPLLGDQSLTDARRRSFPLLSWYWLSTPESDRHIRAYYIQESKHSSAAASWRQER